MKDKSDFVYYNFKITGLDYITIDYYLLIVCYGTYSWIRIPLMAVHLTWKVWRIFQIDSIVLGFSNDAQYAHIIFWNARILSVSELLSDTISSNWQEN